MGPGLDLAMEEGHYLGSWVLAIATEPAKEPGVDRWELPKGRARTREAAGSVSLRQASVASLGTAWAWQLISVGLEVPSKGFHLCPPRHRCQGSSQGVKHRAEGATFPGTGPRQLCVPLGPS